MSEETMASYNKELEASFRKIEEGDIIEGTVIGVTESEVILDLKYYTEGIIRLADYTEDPDFSIKQDVAIGDTVSAEVISLDDGNGNILLSRKQANDVLAWDKLKEYMENGTDLTVQIKGVVNKGVIAYVEGIRGFIPASKLSLSYVENLEDWLLKEIQVRVITADAEAHRLVLSAREILKEKEAEEKKALVSNVQVGLVTEGVVESVKDYGAFVRLSNGLTGLVHVSQISDKHIKNPRTVLNEGDTVKVKVIGIKDGKISLSMKALNDVASEEIQEEAVEIPQAEEIGSNLGALLKGFHFE
ncbi:S1 RNA-binding domain-containing protein [Oscillospiraceae bacterium NTUH-002-81]|jgi:putative S1 RNA binding domain protein|nr:S1 RNA-binding domain-containing protein [Oscillospiraceae bacterium NTUH-002-81]